MYKVFIDGREGTTGLRIYERLASRKDVELILLPEELRKDRSVRKEALNSCDIAFLCLPDLAAKEAVTFVKNDKVILIDSSTAHRTEPGWVYGFPELNLTQREKIKQSKRISVPGCHASGVAALIHPLIEAKILSSDVKISCTSVTGYSGGGKNMIKDYTDENRSPLLDYPRQYALTQQHKHLKEMASIIGLQTFPAFSPIVADYYSGMVVTVPLFQEDLALGCTIAHIKDVFEACYKGPVVTYYDGIDEGGFISAGGLTGKDSMEISVDGNEDRILLIARYDNLGKGASGAAIQCMNIVMGEDETLGLDLE